MPVHSGKPLAVTVEAQRQITVMTDKAQEDLLLAISCLVIAAGSDRTDYLLAVADEYIHNLVGKLRIASNLAKAVPVLGHDLRAQPGLQLQGRDGVGDPGLTGRGRDGISEAEAQAAERAAVTASGEGGHVVEGQGAGPEAS